MLDQVAKQADRAGLQAIITDRYRGRSRWLAMWGVGGGNRAAIRTMHCAAGGFAVLWDIGFFCRSKTHGYVRPSLNDDYCTRWLDQTKPDPARWERMGIALRNDANPSGPIILAGIGPKQRTYMGGVEWERGKLAELKSRFPGRRIIYRPKPKRPALRLPVETAGTGPIEDVLKGASLVVCMHSNVAVDACIAGVPYESEDGVSTWLKGKPYTLETRLDFLQRLSRWQYRQDEIGEGLAFLRSIARA